MDITIEIMKKLGLFVGIPVARSVIGWAQAALKDSKITKFEFKKLIETVVRVGTMSVMLYFGANEIGIDISVLGATAGTFLADVIFKGIKHLK